MSRFTRWIVVYGFAAMFRSGVRVCLSRTARRVALWVYTAALLYGTHGPRRDVEVPGIDRPDLFIHGGAFAGWFLLLLAAEYFGRWRKPRSIVVCAAVAAAFAAVNEATQTMPVFGRTSAWDDYLANLMGIGIGVIAAFLAARFGGRARWA